MFACCDLDERNNRIIICVYLLIIHYLIIHINITDCTLKIQYLGSSHLFLHPTNTGLVVFNIAIFKDIKSYSGC